MKTYPFSALLGRMKYITRWSLMHSTRAESLSEHTCDTALLAHLLCLIAKHYTGTPCRPEVVAVAALYHDAPEIITGDMPTPVKYHSPALRDAYKALETESVRSMAALLPAELAAELTPCMDGSALTAEEHRLLKAADRLSALIKCTEEQRSDMLDELIDRFGEPPEEATALLDIALLRSQASEKGIAEIKQQDGRLLLTFAETDFVRLSALCGDAAFKGRLLLNAGSSPYLSLRLEKTEKAMDMARLLVARYGAAAG